MDAGDDEEDVVLRTSELGKYLESHNVFGHFDALLRPEPVELPAELSTIPQNRYQHFSHHGFICGQNIPEIWLLLLSVFHASKCSEYVQIVLHFVESFCSWICYSHAFVLSILEDIAQKVKISLLQTPVKKSLSKAEEVQLKFSLEHRLSTEAIQLKKCSSQIDSCAGRLNQLILTLLNLRSTNINYSKQCDELISEIVDVRQSITHLIENAEKLLLCQGNSIERFRRRTNRNDVTTSPVVQKPDVDSDEVEEEQPCSTDMDVDEILSSGRLVFESEVPEKCNIEYTTAQRDEVFELTLDEQEHCFPSLPEKYRVEDSYEKEAKLIRAELLTHLRGSLSARRADMEEREARAYAEHYGKPMEKAHADDYIEETQLQSHPMQSKTKSVAFDPKPYSLYEDISIGGDEENFGDEIEESETLSEVRSEFLASLQSMLRKRGGC